MECGVGCSRFPARTAEWPVSPSRLSPSLSSHEPEVCARLFFYHDHGARTGHPPSSPPSPPASLAFIFPTPPLSPPRPPCPATTNDHHGAMRAERSSSQPPCDLLLSASPAPSPSTSPGPCPAVPPWPCGPVRLARLVPHGGRPARSSCSSVRGRSRRRPTQTCAKPRRRSRSRPSGSAHPWPPSVSWLDAAPQAQHIRHADATTRSRPSHLHQHQHPLSRPSRRPRTRRACRART
jgi:hypothetical protein